MFESKEKSKMISHGLVEGTIKESQTTFLIFSFCKNRYYKQMQ